MLQFTRARSLFLEECSRALHGSKPFGELCFPGQECSNLMTVTDVVWIKRMFGDPGLTESERDSWASRINRDQNPDTSHHRFMLAVIAAASTDPGDS